MRFIFQWLILLSDHFSLMAINIKLVEARINRLENEVKALREQRPQS